MSKVDDYLKCKSESEKLRKFADAVNKPYNGGYYADKFGADVSITNTWIGYYGNSSSYTWGDSEVSEIGKEIKLHLRELAESAAKRLEDTTEKARIAAQEEAKQILAIL